MPKMSPDLMKALEAQRRRFKEKFGREPGPGDPVFFDEDADTPHPMDEAKLDELMLGAMLEAGTRPELIYAYRKTGRILTKDTYRRLPRDEREEWDAAIDEFFRLQDEESGKQH